MYPTYLTTRPSAGHTKIDRVCLFSFHVLHITDIRCVCYTRVGNLTLSVPVHLEVASSTGRSQPIICTFISYTYSIPCSVLLTLL